MINDNAYKLLIVDDEYLIRELLEKTVDWNSLGCQIIGKSSCAEEAYDILDEYSVDIVITDINMPVIDGIELSKVIKKQHPKVSIIILTGYNEFEYAKSSIKIGVDDYILKPLNEEEIGTSIKKVIEKIERQKKKDFEYESYKIRLQQNLPYLKEKFLLELLQDRICSKDIEDRSCFFQVNLNTNFFQVSLIQIIMCGEHLVEEERLITLFRIKNIVEQNFKDYKNIYILMDTQEHLVILSTNPEVNMIEELNYLHKIIKHNINWDTAIGIGSVKSIIHNIKNSYKEGLSALQYKTIIGNNKVIHYNDIGMVNEEDSDFPHIDESELDQLQFLIKAGLHNDAICYVEGLYNKMCINKQVDENNFIAYIRVQTTRIISVLYYMISSMNITIEDITQEQDCFDKIYSFTTVPDAKNFLIELINKIIDYFKNLQVNKVNNIIEEIDQFINDNIDNPSLTLKSTADHFYMNPSYLSRMYKQKKGISFKEHVNKIRMEIVIDLLKNTDLKVYEIGEKVGIPDPNYFSSCFKKYMNMSISEYKKNIFN